MISLLLIIAFLSMLVYAFAYLMVYIFTIPIVLAEASKSRKWLLAVGFAILSFLLLLWVLKVI